MIIDNRTELADAAAIALNIGNAIMPNSDVIDLGATPTLRDLGSGEPLWLVIQVDTSLVGSGASVQLQLVSDSVAALTTSRTIHIDTGAIAITSLTAGYLKAYALPIEATFERYLGLWMTVYTANVTAGAISAYLVKDVSAWRTYDDGVTQNV